MPRAPSLRILLPLSDRKVAGGRSGTTFTRHARPAAAFAVLAKPRAEVLAAFRETMRLEARALKALALDGDRFREVWKLNRALDTTPVMPALDRSGGALADTLAFDTLDDAARAHLADSALLLCPLLGLLTPRDLVPDYRCPAGASLWDMGSIHKFWKPHITRALNVAFRGCTVLSLLPARLAALWEPDGTADAILTVHFSRSGRRGARGETAAAPRLTGEILRFVASTGASSCTELVRFKSSSGHTYSAAHSSTSGALRRLHFVR